MPRYVVQRTFPEGLHIPVDDSGAERRTYPRGDS